jgi:alkanesulfonate monooxygenase SsuD/methylene tetrahydromethanopterin reductase-like flavin-dependent oxidoreductase (luciferase family)
MSKLGISMPILNQVYTKFPEMAKLADEAGFDSVWDYEFYRNPFVIHALCARETRNIKLATGLATAVSRSPFEMANAALDVDELSGGRTILGIGTGGEGWASILNGGDVDHALSRINEYMDILRMAWKHLATGEPCGYHGKYYRFEVPPVNIFGLRRDIVRTAIPIYVSGRRPKMAQMAGEKAEGFLGFLLSAKYVKDVIQPNIAIGAQRAGRDPAGVDTTALVLCCVSDDRKEALRRARINVGIYAASPMVDVVIEHMGLTEDRDAMLQALMTEGPQSLERTTSDALVKAFSIAGTPAECVEQYAEYKEVLSHVVLHTPYVPPISQADSEDAFRNTVRTFGRGK